MTSNLLQSLETKEQLHSVLAAINEAFPNNTSIENELGKYTASKEQAIKRLQEKWYNRDLPLYTELQVRQLNSSFYSEKAAKQVAANLGGKTYIEMDPRNWVVKTPSKWSGWNAVQSVYYDMPILFEGDILFEKNFAPLVVADKDSQSVNLLVSLSKLITKGNQMCLSDSNWAGMFLSFASVYMPGDHPNLMKYTDDVDGLFEALVSSVNADSEIAKLRSSMAQITRKPNDSIQTPMYRLRACYEMLLSINFPDLDLDKVKIRSDNYSCNSVKYLVSANTAKFINEYILLKQQRSEHLSLVKLCNVVTTHEASNPADRLQQVVSLPLVATRLDTSLTAASNVEELLVASSGVTQQNFSRISRSRSNSIGKQFGQRGRSPFKNSDQWHSSKSLNNGHQGPNKYSNSSSQQVASNGKYQVNKGMQDAKGRGASPARSYFRSPGGRYYREVSKSPMRARSNSRDNRNRSKSPKKVCLRCLDSSHLAGECPHYAFYNGKACSLCGGLHKTDNHKNDLYGRRLSGQKITRSNNAEFEIEVDHRITGDQVETKPNIFRAKDAHEIFGSSKNA